MAEVKWIKIVTDIFDDEKIRFIESMPNGDGILVVWFKLLCLAGKSNAFGYLMFTSRLPYTDEMLASIFRRDIKEIKYALELFQELEMVEIENNKISITNWEKHQNIDGMEKIREQTRKRVQEHRERKKMLECNVTSNVSVTQCNATEEEIDKDINIDQIDTSNEVDLVPSPSKKTNENKLLEDEFESLWNIYPKKEGKAKAKEKYMKYRKSKKDYCTYEEVLKGIENYNTYIKQNKIEMKYVKQGSTYFNQKCWEDQYQLREENDYGVNILW